MPDRPHDLSPEQIRILELVARGWTDIRIARQLQLSRTTVHRRLQAASQHLHATSRINLVLRAVELGLISTPPEGADAEPIDR